MRCRTVATLLLLAGAPSQMLPQQAVATANGALASYDQALQAAARQAAEHCLGDPRCLESDRLDAPLGSLEPARARQLRELAILVEVALAAHARELSRHAGARESLPADHDRRRLDRFGSGELRLGGIADYVEVAIHLRGRVAAADGVHPAAVVHFAERLSGRPPRVSRLVLPIAGVSLVAAADDDEGLQLPAPRLQWRGAVLEELHDGVWQRVLEPDPVRQRRHLAETGFCDAACAESSAPRPSGRSAAETESWSLPP